MKTMNVLITGITGFIGKYLAYECVNEGHVVYGSTYAKNEKPPNNKNINLLPCDMKKKHEVENLVSWSKPDIVFHLAAQPYPMKSWENPINTFKTNVDGSIHLFAAIMKEKLDPAIVVACSSAEYGFTAFDMEGKLRENDPLLPVHPYGLTKVCQDLLSLQYYKQYGMKLIRARIFNTIGPGKKGDFVGDVSIQIAKINKNLQRPVVKVGNLQTKRDVTDVRDQVSALMALVKSGKIGEAYNICSGENITMQKLLDIMLSMSEKKIEVQTDPLKVRQTDEPLIVGDPSKLKKDCSWIQKYTTTQTLEDSVKFWYTELQ